jgi:hypothetical protein
MPEFRASSRDGALEIVPEDRARYRAYLRRVVGRLHVRLSKHRGKRSIPQLRWIRGIAIPIIAEELGWDRQDYEDVHYWLLRRCFGTRQTKLGDEVPNVKHTGDLNTKESAQYQEWLIRFAATEWGIVVPAPNEPVEVGAFYPEE